MVITYFFRRILMFLAVLFICPFVAYGAETCSAGQMLVDGACVEPAFTITTTDMAAESTFSFKIYASGTFYVDFDDGRGVQKIVRTDTTTNPTYTSAAYANAGTHIIKMYGGATGYSTSYYIAAISFANNTNIKSVDGSLGAIFGGSTKSMFHYTFSGCTSLQYISGNLFDGVTDSAEGMFAGTFAGCTSLQSIPENLFSGVSGSAESMFEGTFYGCTSLPSIPDTLFSGVSGSAWSMFDSTFAYCTSLPSIPDTLFEGVRGSANGMFYGTFKGCTLLESIPGTLFSGVSGSASEMFLNTFRDCTSLQSIPENLFEGVTGSASRMFDTTFFGCTSLKSLPKGLFKNIEGRPADAFNGTFYGCSDLSGYIPSDMFENLDSTDYTSGPMYNIFAETNLDTTCPVGTYQYITGFESDWSGKVSCGTCPDGMIAIDGVCTKVDCTENQDGACLEPEFTITTTDMAAGTVFEFSISAAGTYYIDWGDDSDIEIIEKTDTTNTPYSHTYADGGVHTIGMGGDATKYASFRSAISFSGNKNIAALGGSLGEIFDGSARRMFYQTFMDCTSLQSIPESLFSGVTVTNPQIFYSTFKGCTSLESLPSGLFKNITNDGSLANGMFGETFAGCSKLSGYIPSDMFAGLDITHYTSGPMTDIFAGTNLDTVCPAGTYQYITGFESDWSGKVSCGTCPEGSTIAASGTSCICNNGDAFVDGACIEPEFTITTTDMAAETVFDFGISAAGTYYIDWGDGTSKVIKKTNTKATDYKHTYEKAGVYTIKMAGGATEYGTTAAIGFENNTNIAALGGSLGAIFGGPARTYMFAGAFYGCTSLKSIPETLFSGISGSASQMFLLTFGGCTSLKSIPDNLFSGVSGSAGSMFGYTFAGCTSLQSIPETLFSNISGSAEWMFGYTFGQCTSLKSLPKGLFKNIEGRPATSAFNSTFAGCSKLSGYIPSDMFEKMDSTDYTSGSMTDIFAGTNLDTVCPAGTYQYITGFESDWSGKVSCSLCPGGYTSDVGATAENMCYKTCSIPCTQQPCPENSINCENAITSTFGKQYYGGTCDVAATTCKITFDCASGHYMNNGMCAPCPDGMCSINKPCSPSANTTGETTCQYNANTGDYSDCNECRFVSCNDGYQYINGECKIVVTCNPGQYLPAGASECAPCPAGSYCIGNTTYIYNPNYHQGISGNCNSGSYSSAGASKCTECPFVTDPYGGLFAEVYSYGDSDSIDKCVATYEYLPEYMLEVAFGITVQEAIDVFGYNPDSDANKRGYFMAQCHYDTVTQQYTKDCMGQIAMCEGGYYTNGEINEEFVGLPFPYLEASTLEEMLNTYCVPAEPGYWSPGLPHTDFENITQEELSLTWVRNACPAGTTSGAGASDISHCVGGRTLHIGDDITMNLTTERPTTPRVMVFQVLDELYYGGLSDTEKTINKNTDKKFRIFFDNKDYWLHDYTVE